jgi:hypothetical protein
VSIVVAEEQVFPLADTPKHVPPRRGGRPLHPATAFRWRNPGVRGVKLETIRVGGTLCTSVEALQRFFERLSATDGTEPASPPPSAPLAARRTPAARLKALEKARRELEQLGIRPARGSTTNEPR